MSSKIGELSKKIEQKKQNLAKEIEARDKKIEAVQKLEYDLKILEAELVTAHLVAHNMTIDDLASLLGPADREGAYVSSD